jgi:hypothetical protein
LNLNLIIKALSLPSSCLIGQKLPKKVLTERGCRTAAERRLIKDTISKVDWVASLKPTTIGVKAYRDEAREYQEVQVFHAELRGKAKVSKFMELFHRSIAYPLLLIVSFEKEITISVAHKRHSLSEKGAVVVDDGIIAATIASLQSADSVNAFINSLAVPSQPHTDLLDFYNGWVASITGRIVERRIRKFSLPDSPEDAANMRIAVAECQRIEDRMVSIRKEAAREKQMPRHVELNMELQQLQAALADLIADLQQVKKS